MIPAPVLPHWSTPPRRSVWPILAAGFGGLTAGVIISIVVAVVVFFSDMGISLVTTYESNSPATDVSTKECLEGDDLRAADARVVSCEEAHGLEVYERRPALSREDAPYPKDDLEYIGDAICLAAFEPYVASTYDDSSLEYETFVPTREAWADGERDVICALYQFEGGPLEGTSEGSGR